MNWKQKVVESCSPSIVYNMDSQMKAQISQSIVERLRKYSPEIVQLDQRPLLSDTFVFPWKPFCDEINSSLHLDLSLEPGELRWREFSDLDSGICAPYKTLNFVMPGTSGEISVLLAQGDIENAMQTVLNVPIAKISLEDQSFQDQFWLFLLVEVLCCVQVTPSIAALGVRYKGSDPLEERRYLCQDIGLSIGEVRSLARLVISPEFLSSWLQKVSPGQEKQELVDVDIDVAVEAARIQMTSEEIRNLEVGEFLLPTHVFYMPGSAKARVYLTYQEEPLFRGKLDNGKLTILEMPLVHEAFLPQGGRSVSSVTDALSEDEKNLFEGEAIEEGEASSEVSVESAKAEAISSGLLKEPFDVTKIPLSVSVQIGKLRLSVKELSEMQSGNVLDLNVQPEDGVSLVANGAVFGKGSLILIGDSLGVQITEIYKA
jgi:flagellar motor switch protein FliN